MLVTKRLHVCNGTVHGNAALSWVDRTKPDVGLHAMGVIYRRSLIRRFKLGILNPHIGLLPRYRGRSVMEWSILEGNPTGITVFFVDEGIDTGPRIVLRKAVDVSSFRDVGLAKSYLFSLDGAVFAEALRSLAVRPDAFQTQRREDGKRYYVMSELFSSVVAARLAQHEDCVSDSKP